LTKKLALMLAAVLLTLAGAEMALRVAGYRAYATPVVVRGEASESVEGVEAIVPDPRLIWRFKPGAMFNGRRINSLGHIGREVDPVKQPGVRRVICMGDSCSGQGMPPYSGYLHRMLTNAPPTSEPWEAFNMAVHGYSVLQGLRLFQIRGRELKPDIVTLYFGWNDHWLRDRPDRNQMAVELHPLTARVLVRLQRFRIFQLIASAVRPGRLALSHGNKGHIRVPIEDYETALVEFIREIRAVGATPLLITAPRAEKLSAMLVHNGQAESVEEAQRLHDLYVETGRRVAREHDVLLLDLAAIFSGPGHPHLFSRDGIHFTTEGLLRVAEELYAKIKAIEPR
jgi:lysophospholipase L1-like esterase